MSEPQATVSRRRRVPAIWLVPIVAALLGIWMVVYTAITEGPEITILFSTAQGIEEGKTKLKTRNVELGVVEKVTLNEDLESVTVVAKLEYEAAQLLREDTRFWVVRPRLGASGVSGLGTIMSGAYIEVEPGTGPASARRDFVGLDDLPLTPVDAPGLQLVLLSRRAGSAGPGAPVLFHGFPVGQIEETSFDPETRRVRHSVFIDAPYDALVDRATRFWDASGIALDASAQGIRLELGSLQSLLVGGVAFEIPESRSPLGPVAKNAEFELFDSYPDTLEESYRHSLEYVVRFDQSIRGLVPGAPVEYRGIELGLVQRIMLPELFAIMDEAASGQAIPVLISLHPGRIGSDTEEGAKLLRKELKLNAQDGLRATLQSGNLLTGRLYIGLEYYPDEPRAKPGTFAGYPTLPTLSGGLQRIERQLSSVLAKVNDLPLETMLAELNGTLREARALVGSESFQALPGSLNATLAELETTLQSFAPDSRTMGELNRTLQALEVLSRTLEEQPNSLVFPKRIRRDPAPGGDQ